MQPKRRRSRGWLTIAVTLGVLYVLAALTACAVADGMLFHPEYGSRAAPPGGFFIAPKDGGKLSAVHLPNPDARFTLWYFHGNAEDLGDIMPRLRAYRESGFSVFAVDYPGYGLSEGKPTEASIYASTQAAFGYLRDELKIPPQRLVLYGRSVGAGPAIELARREPVAGLVVESAFMSAYRVMTHWPILPGDMFQNLRKLTSVRCPVLVIHGRRDEVVPFTHGEALFAAARGKKQCLWVEGAEHNDVLYIAGGSYWQALRKFAQEL